MDRIVRTYNRGSLAKAALFWMVLFVAGAGVARADLIGELCDPAAEPEKVIEALVEETEATGMPLVTLNRLLAVGYRSAEAEADLTRIMCTVIQSEEQGLPVNPIFEKLEEGLGKRAPLKTIQTVIVNKAGELKYVQDLVAAGGEPVVDDLNVQRIADLLDTGISKDKLDRLFGETYDAPTEMRVVASEIEAYGALAGFSREALDRIVSTGLKNRSLTPEWSFFIQLIKEARKNGIPDEKTGAAAVEILSKKSSMDVLIGRLGLNKKRIY